MRREVFFILMIGLIAGGYRLMREAFPAKSGAPDPVSFLTSVRTELISDRGDKALYCVSPTTIGTTDLYRAWVVRYSLLTGYTACWSGWVEDRKNVYAYWAGESQIVVTSVGSDYESILDGSASIPTSQVVMVE